MRYPRLSPAGQADPWPAAPPPLVAVAHGSKDPRAAATVSELLAAVRALSPGLEVRTAFLDHCAPALPQVLGSLGAAPAVVVPLLLTAAYHSKTDIPAQLAAAAAAAGPGREIVAAATLGPHPLLLRALERRLAEAGADAADAAARAATSVVLAAAGSSDPAANRAVAGLAARWQHDRGWRTVVPAYASAAAPGPGAAVRALRAAGHRRVVVATYLIAPGYFADKISAGSLGAGAAAVSPVLGAAPEVAQVVLDRYAAAALSLASAAPASAEPRGPQTVSGRVPARVRR